MSDYWKDYWQSHAQASYEADAQVQVLRTLDRKPIPAEVFDLILESVFAVLRLEPGHRCLDLCCGNGLITQHLADQVESIVAVDFAQPLLDQFDVAKHPNIQTVCVSVLEADFPQQSFDRILLYAGVQYFSHAETVELFGKLKQWVRPGGIVFLGDIPDQSRMWNFFNSPDRRNAYFRSLIQDGPIVGTWFDPKWLSHLSTSCGFSEFTLCEQPSNFPFAHYRFDMQLIR